MSYILIDPVNRPTSGITSYVQAAAGRLRPILAVSVVARKAGEPIPDFRNRVAAEVSALDEPGVIVEAPETYASTLQLRPPQRVHIRLHCPSTISAQYDGKVPEREAVLAEKQVIARAAAVSAPSWSMAREVWRLAKLPDQFVYFNPIGLDRPNGHPPPWPDRDVDVLFLGRFQQLKGATLLPAILRALHGHVRRVVAGPGARAFVASAGLSNVAEAVEAPTEGSKLQWLARARVVIVPSLFESFSMVQAEALAAGAVVVGFDNAALAELAAPPLVLTAPAWDAAALAARIEAALASESPSPAQFAAAIRRINQGFDAGSARLRAALLGVGSHGPDQVRPPPIAHLRRPIGSLLDAAGIPREHTHMSARTWQRKVRKLCRDPKQFIQDMRLMRTLRVRLQPMAARRIGRNPATATEASGAAKRRPPSPAAGDHPLEPMEAAELLWHKNMLACRIIERRIADFRLSSLVFLRRSHRLLINEPYAHAMLRDPEFVGFRANYLHFGAYETTPTTVFDDAEIINQIPAQQRLVLARHQNLVFIDPVCRLPYALRSLSATSRLFIVLTRQADPTFDLRSEEVDVLLVDGGHPDAGRQNLRRKIVFNGQENMLGTLKRAIVEASSRPHNVLLPVMNGLRFQPDLLRVNTREVDGILVCGTLDGGMAEGERIATFERWLDRFCGNLAEIYLAEETLLRYRSLCEEAETDPGRWPLMLAMSLRDGARYDVRN